MFYIYFLIIAVFVVPNILLLGCKGSDGRKIEDTTKRVQNQPKPKTDLSIEHNSSSEKLKFVIVENNGTSSKKDINLTMVPDKNISYSLVKEASFTDYGNINTCTPLDENSNMICGFSNGLLFLKYLGEGSFEVEKKIRGLNYIEDIVSLESKRSVLISNGYMGLERYDPFIKELSHIGTTADGGWAGEIEVDQNRSYIAYGSQGVEIVNFDQNGSFVNDTNFDTSGYVQGIYLYSIKSMLFLAKGYDGVEVLEIKDDTNISSLSHISIENEWVNGVSVEESRELLFAGTDRSGILIYDIGDILKPKLIGTIESNTTLQKMELKRNLLFAIKDKKSLEILDISKIDDIRKVFGLDTGSYINSVKYTPIDERVYISTQKGIFIYHLIKESL
ncbi:MAG: hypothetical protein DSZ06_03960 [Sulfurospirillum sp.]|nr:MAG: hypothetical protein DSZ06_03960 [Sulfurospirillum sp.]